MTSTVMTLSPSFSVLSSMVHCWVSSVFWVAWGQGTRLRRKLIEDTRRHHSTNGDNLCELSHDFNVEYKQLLDRNCISFITIALSLSTNFKHKLWDRPMLVSSNTDE